MKTSSAKKVPENRRWYLVDATDLTLGRLASQVASRLRGKHQPIYTPHVDTGDFIVVINADRVRLTGNKWQQKTYYRHSGYIGGLKSLTARKLREKRPEDLVRYAVWGMLPKNRLGRRLYKKLKVYTGPNHPHEAQQPEKLELPY
ncbi:MAG: 50S ribosomal protein L13 [Syntrophobacteria bacterium]